MAERRRCVDSAPNAIPRARLEIVPGEAHELPLANPAAANPIMLAFLGQKPL
jgi:pimeloyl-ACP methyl ester carboxylesterase